MDFPLLTPQTVIYSEFSSPVGHPHPLHCPIPESIQTSPHHDNALNNPAPSGLTDLLHQHSKPPDPHHHNRAMNLGGQSLCRCPILLELPSSTHQKLRFSTDFQITAPNPTAPTCLPFSFILVQDVIFRPHSTDQHVEQRPQESELEWCDSLAIRSIHCLSVHCPHTLCLQIVFPQIVRSHTVIYRLLERGEEERGL